MSENEEHFRVTRGSEKSFGFTFCVVFALFSFYSYAYSSVKNLWLIFLFVSFTFLILALVKPRIFFLSNILWFKLGMVLGHIAAPLAMAIIFYLVITPIGLILRALGKDFIGTKNKNTISYWVKRTDPINSMKDQF